MAAYQFDRRRNDRRRGGARGTYAGPERRATRDRRGAQGRRGYDRRHSDSNGEERESYYYSGQKKQNPMIYFGVGGGVLLLIIIIAVAASSSPDKAADRNRARSDGDVLQKEQRAKQMVMDGGRAMEAARSAYNESGVSAAYSHYVQAYEQFSHAHDIYEELNDRYPNSRFYGALKDVESNLSEALKMMGTGNQ